MTTVDGSTWYDSGSISTDSFQDSLTRPVECGHTYSVFVTGTDSEGNSYAYRETVETPEPTPEEPDDEPVPPVQTTLYAAMAASAHCTSSGPECNCQLSVSVDGKDLTGGSYPITRVVLRVNGQVSDNSGGVSTTHYNKTVTKTVSCGAMFSLQLTVANSIGQTATSTGAITTPVP